VSRIVAARTLRRTAGAPRPNGSKPKPGDLDLRSEFLIYYKYLNLY
jgi:hypothetical protein